MDNIVVFTDGSCVSNGFVDATGGYGIHFPNKELEDVSEPFTKKPITNQRAELYAIYVALKMIVRELDFKKVSLYTDSEYSIKCLTKWIHTWEKNGWITDKKEPIKNQDIIKIIKKIMDRHPGKIELIHVRSHTGGSGYEAQQNDVADKLACKGTEKCRKMLLTEREDILYVDTKQNVGELKDVVVVPRKKDKRRIAKGIKICT